MIRSLQKIIQLKGGKTFFPCIIFVLSLFSYDHSFAFVKNNLENKNTLRILEEKIWTSKIGDKHLLENEVISKLSSKEDNETFYYLLSILHLNAFKQNKESTENLNKSFELTQKILTLNSKSNLAHLSIAYTHYLLGSKENALNKLLLIDEPDFKKNWQFVFLKSLITFNERTLQSKLAHISYLISTQNISKKIILNHFSDKISPEISMDKSINALDNFIRIQNFDKLYSILAQWYTLNQDFENAYNVFKKIISQNNHTTKDIINYVNLLISRKGNHKKALKILEYQIQESKIKKEKSILYYYQGIINILDNKGKIAEQYFKKSITHYPEQNYEILFSFLMEQNKAKTLIKIIDFINLNYGGSAYLYAIKGDIFSRFKSKYNDSIIAYKNSLILDAEQSDIYNSIGVVYYHLKQYDLALEYFKKSFYLDKSHSKSIYNIGCIFALKGEKQTSLSYIERALSMDTSLIAKAKIDKDLTLIQNSQEFEKIIEMQENDF